MKSPFTRDAARAGARLADAEKNSRVLEAYAAELNDAPEPEDIDETRALRARRAAANENVAIARERVAERRAELEVAEAAAAERADKARHAAAQKAAEEDERLVREISSEMHKLAPKLERLRERNRQVAEVNRELGSRYGHILNGEQRVRMSEPRHYPARTRTEKVWLDAHDERCTFLVLDPKTGDMVPQNLSSYRLTEVEVIEVPARDEPARMPPSLTVAVVLPGLKDGDPTIWPPRGLAQ